MQTEIYTVKKLSKLSKVSVRTLHYYDEIDLLKPAYLGVNNYRYYLKEQLLMLQQILFFKELGFELKVIKEIITKDDFNKISALISHRAVIKKDIASKRELLKTLDKTILHLKGDKTMSNKELYHGFDPSRQKEYEQYMVKRYGSKGRDFNLRES